MPNPKVIILSQLFETDPNEFDSIAGNTADLGDILNSVKGKRNQRDIPVVLYDGTHYYTVTVEEEH